MSMPAAVASRIGRPDQARVEGRGGVSRLGLARIYGGGATAVGLSTEARFGSARGNFSLDTGTISVLMLAAIVVGTFAFYSWTRSAQA